MSLSFDDVRPLAQGQWLVILFQVAPALVNAVEQQPKHVSCPVHGGKDGFRLYKDADITGGGVCNTCGAFSDGFALISWCNGWQLADTLKAVANFLGIDEIINQSYKPIVKRSSLVTVPDKNLKTIKRKRERLNAVKTELVTLSDEKAKPVRQYLVNRGLGDVLKSLPNNLFFHPTLPYWEDGKDYGKHPCMVGLLQNKDGLPITYHRTYIDINGDKAELPTVKKLMPPAVPGSTKGGAIRLCPAEDELVLAEGIETALALYLSLKKPAWACVSAGGMEAVQLPKRVQNVIIGSDNDQNGTGQKAAYKLANRLLKENKGIQVKIITPEKSGTDWLDVSNSERNIT